MKRRDLERKLRIAGCYLKREGTSHSYVRPSQIDEDESLAKPLRYNPNIYAFRMNFPLKIDSCQGHPPLV